MELVLRVCVLPRARVGQRNDWSWRSHHWQLSQRVWIASHVATARTWQKPKRRGPESALRQTERTCGLTLCVWRKAQGVRTNTGRGRGGSQEIRARAVGRGRVGETRGVVVTIRRVCGASLRRTARLPPDKLVAQRWRKTGWCVPSFPRQAPVVRW